MTKAEKIRLGLLVFIAIMGIIMIVNIFSPIKKDNKDFDREMKMHDEIVQSIQNERAAYQKLNEQYERSLADHYKQDSILADLVKQNQKQYVSLNKKYDQIPAIINNLSKDSLRLLFSRYNMP